MTEQQGGEWHTAKVFSISHLVISAGFMLTISGYLYFFGSEYGVLKADVDRHEEQIKDIRAEQVVRDNAISRKLTDMRKEQKADNQRIEDKLDRLIEREISR